MDYLLQNPVEFEGQTYDLALFFGSFAPVIQGNDYTTAVNIQVIPARRTETEIITLSSHAVIIELTPDIKNRPSSQDNLLGYGQVSAVIIGLAQQMGIVAIPQA